MNDKLEKTEKKNIIY